MKGATRIAYNVYTIRCFLMSIKCICANHVKSNMLKMEVNLNIWGLYILIFSVNSMQNLCILDAKFL